MFLILHTWHVEQSLSIQLINILYIKSDDCVDSNDDVKLHEPVNVSYKNPTTGKVELRKRCVWAVKHQKKKPTKKRKNKKLWNGERKGKFTYPQSWG